MAPQPRKRRGARGEAGCEVSGRRAAGSLRKRGATWFLRYYAAGRLVEESAQTGDERAARSLLVQRQREIAAGTWRAPGGRVEVLTVSAYLDSWIARRTASGVHNADTEAALFDRHVKPVIGSLPLASLTRVHVRDLVGKVLATTGERTGDVLAPRTVLHVYRTLATACADAVLDKRIPETPCTLRTRRGELPRKRDKDPKWRALAVYSRDEAETMIASSVVPSDRRTLYALQLLAGQRVSEARGRRWRDYDPDAKPLGRLTVASQADTGPDGEHDTKTQEVRSVPVVPALAAILEEWKRTGFPLLFGRHPQPDDPIVPSREDPTGRSFRSQSAVFERLVDDLASANVRRVPSPGLAMRATFLTLLENDGANMGIARRATHKAPSDIVGGYIRTSWADLCREIGKLTLAPKPRATVHSLSFASPSSEGPDAPEYGADHGDPDVGARKGPKIGRSEWAILDLKRPRGEESSESRESTEPPSPMGDRKRRGKSHVAKPETQTWGDAHVPGDAIARALVVLERLAIDLDRSAYGRKAAEVRRLAERWRGDKPAAESREAHSEPSRGSGGGTG